MEESAKLLKKEKAPLTPLQIRVNGETKAYMPLDLDVSPFDNSKMKKEGVSRTYRLMDMPLSLPILDKKDMALT